MPDVAIKTYHFGFCLVKSINKSPVKFAEVRQAGALVHIYTDGTAGFWGEIWDIDIMMGIWYVYNSTWEKIPKVRVV